MKTERNANETQIKFKINPFEEKIKSKRNSDENHNENQMKHG